jgi:hypothetical protein
MKAAADTLAAEIQTTRAFFESAAEGILIVSVAGRIVRANARGEAMFGYAQDELLGQPIECLLPERLRAAHRGHRTHYFDAPRTRSMGLGLNLFGQRKDGSEFPIEISLTSIQTADGLLAMALVTDISERRALEQVARQQEKLVALATLSAGIAHELKQSHWNHLDAHRAHAAGRRVTATSDRGRRRSPCAVPQHPAHLALERALGPMWGHGDALQQVLINLLLNARDAMPGGGQIRIETGPHPDRSGWMRLVVADTGDGMGPEGLAKLWEPFYTTKASGTGLGLSVSHKIIREHGGVVDVLSAPGHGTTFDIQFPLHKHA